MSKPTVISAHPRVASAAPGRACLHRSPVPGPSRQQQGDPRHDARRQHGPARRPTRRRPRGRRRSAAASRSRGAVRPRARAGAPAPRAPSRPRRPSPSRRPTRLLRASGSPWMRARPRNSEAKPFDMLHTASRKPTTATPLLGSVRMSMIVVPISPPAVPRVLSTNSMISARTSSAACFADEHLEPAQDRGDGQRCGDDAQDRPVRDAGGDVLDGMALVGVTEGDGQALHARLRLSHRVRRSRPWRTAAACRAGGGR